MRLPKIKQHQTVVLPVQSISPNPNQPRKNFDEESLRQLAQSIREIGLLQPVIVTRTDQGSYLLIAGERRYRAALLAEQDKIPAIIRQVDKRHSAIIALTENLQREDLTYFEEALAYASLMNDYHFTQMEIAKMVGKQQSTISNKIRLLSLPEEIRDLLTGHHLTERHARALLSLPSPSLQKDVIERIIKEGFNIQQTEKFIASLTAAPEGAEKSPPSQRASSPCKTYLSSLKRVFGSIKKSTSLAEFKETDKGDFIEVRIRIPKDEAKTASVT